MTRKLFIETHGCQMNEYDSSRMVDLLGEHQTMEITENPAEADVILLNTCSIREKAQDKVFSQLGRWRELKLANPDLVIGVGGCSSAAAMSVLLRLPQVAWRECKPRKPKGARRGYSGSDARRRS